MKLKFTRQDWSGTYYATTDTHTFAVDKPGPKWCLRIWAPPGGSMVKYDPDFPTAASAKAAAQTFADEQESHDA